MQFLEQFDNQICVDSGHVLVLFDATVSSTFIGSDEQADEFVAKYYEGAHEMEDPEKIENLRNIMTDFMSLGE